MSLCPGLYFCLALDNFRLLARLSWERNLPSAYASRGVNATPIHSRTSTGVFTLLWVEKSTWSRLKSFGSAS